MRVRASRIRVRASRTRSWKERKPLAVALRPIYTAPNADAAAAALDAFERSPWGTKFPTVVASRRRAWTHVIPFFAFPPDVRRLIYTTNALESVHARLRKIIKTRGHFPNDEAAVKLLWLALRNITGSWGRVAYNWRSAMNQFAILYEGRFPLANTQNAAHGRRRPCGRTERPTGTWKTAEHAVSHSAHTHR
jgi:transposase-like protein